MNVYKIRAKDIQFAAWFIRFDSLWILFPEKSISWVLDSVSTIWKVLERPESILSNFLYVRQRSSSLKSI